MAVEDFEGGRAVGGKAAAGGRLPAVVLQGKGCTHPVVVGRGCIPAGVAHTDCTPGAWEGHTPVGGRACWAALGRARGSHLAEGGRQHLEEHQRMGWLLEGDRSGHNLISNLSAFYTQGPCVFSKKNTIKVWISSCYLRYHGTA